MADMMTFPDTVEEFMESYKVVDSEGIYMSKGSELVPIFRMKQWFEHMPSVQSEQTNCNYCHEDCDGYVKPIEKNCHAFIRFGMNGWEISLSAKGWNGSAKIMYCPMCGRKLKNDK